MTEAVPVIFLVMFRHRQKQCLGNPSTFPIPAFGQKRCWPHSQKKRRMNGQWCLSTQFKRESGTAWLVGEWSAGKSLLFIRLWGLGWASTLLVSTLLVSILLVLILFEQRFLTRDAPGLSSQLLLNVLFDKQKQCWLEWRCNFFIPLPMCFCLTSVENSGQQVTHTHIPPLLADSIFPHLTVMHLHWWCSPVTRNSQEFDGGSRGNPGPAGFGSVLRCATGKLVNAF